MNFKKKKMELLTKGLQKLYENAKICYSCIEKFENKYVKHKKYSKVRDHDLVSGAARSICNSKYIVPVAFHNGSNYDYHFIVKELAEEFKKQFDCLGENTEKYLTFTVPIEGEVTK